MNMLSIAVYDGTDILLVMQGVSEKTQLRGNSKEICLVL